MNRFYSMTEMKQLNQQDIADYISKSMEKYSDMGNGTRGAAGSGNDGVKTTNNI